MTDAVASQVQLCAPPLAAHSPDVERLREQVADFEELIEAMLKRLERTDRELRDAKEEIKRLTEENKRLRGE